VRAHFQEAVDGFAKVKTSTIDAETKGDLPQGIHHISADATDIFNERVKMLLSKEGFDDMVDSIMKSKSK
jgi:hypothetical protein